MNLLAFKLLADENIHTDVIGILRANGCDIASVYDLGVDGKDDADVLATALTEKRVIITHDRDFGRLAILGRHPFYAIVYLRPGHRGTQFTLDTISAIESKSLPFIPPFIVVANRKHERIAIRYRQFQ